LDVAQVTAVTDTLTVPVAWVFSILGILLFAFAWWLRTEWSRNWKEHEAMKAMAAATHTELDDRIDKHSDRIDAHVTRIHRRIDWIIQHASGMPDFPIEEDEDV